MKEIFLIKNGELALKGLNRSTFEDVLVKNIKGRISKIGKFEIKKAQSTIYIDSLDDKCDFDLVADILSKTFGIARYSRAAVCEKDMQSIINTAIDYFSDTLSTAATFKVEAKRADKKFIHNSPKICELLGEALLNAYPHLKVDVRTPQTTVFVEVRDFAAYVRKEQEKGIGGLPVGTSGNAMLLISGGIDSPVAGYMMAKRGIRLTAVHFASPPYTSQRAEDKVRSLLKLVSRYAGVIDFLIVPFTEIQEQIAKNCPEDLNTVIMRRQMMRIAEKLANIHNSLALVTGECVAQVASQTIQALACTDNAVSLPVFRPLIGMDKDEIVEIARKIDTFETSILPYEDCCTVFTPKHPRTKPTISMVEVAESAVDFDTLINTALENTHKEYVISTTWRG